MPKVKEKVGPRGLLIPKVVLEESGLHEGMSVIMEPAAGVLRIVPEEVSAAVIRKTALRYLLHDVGDAVEVSAPRPIGEGDKWQVNVTLPYRQLHLGVLTYTVNGVLLPEESTSPEDMVRKAHET